MGGGAALPGMILNTSKKTTFVDAATGQERSVAAGRMECTMQVCFCTVCPVLLSSSNHFKVVEAVLVSYAPGRGFTAACKVPGNVHCH